MWVLSSVPFLTDMGHARRRPKRLAEKLLQIRKALGLSQREMAERLDAGINRNHVSKFERDKSEPTLKELLAYARIAGVLLERIIDDDAELTLDS